MAGSQQILLSNSSKDQIQDGLVSPTQRRLIAMPMGTQVFFPIFSKHVVKHFSANNAYTKKPYKKNSR